MRKIFTILICLLLTACVDDTASYYVDGRDGNHALTVHRAQQHFWNDEVSVELVLSRLPDCQRRLVLTTLPADDVNVELYSNGDNVWTLRQDKELWQVETQTCSKYPDVKNNAGNLGELIGVFRVDGNKLVFAAAVASTDAAPAAQPAPAAQTAPAADAPAQ